MQASSLGPPRCLLLATPGLQSIITPKPSPTEVSRAQSSAPGDVFCLLAKAVLSLTRFSYRASVSFLNPQWQENINGWTQLER